jgi:hypothetical protein
MPGSDYLKNLASKAGKVRAWGSVNRPAGIVTGWLFDVAVEAIREEGSAGRATTIDDLQEPAGIWMGAGRKRRSGRMAAGWRARIPFGVESA